jgi:AcrR family transcriptional regulator
MAGETQTRRRMSAEDRREQLLEVTTEIVIERSFHAVSIEAVAQRAGVTRALIYQHFSDLPALLETVVEREMSRALAQVSETALTNLSEGDPRELMLESLHAFLNAVRDHPTTWRLVLMAPQGAPESLRQSIANGRAIVLAQLAEAVQPLVEAAGEAGDAELTAHVLSAVSDEYARLVLTDAERHPPERLLRHARWWLEGVRV